MEALLLTLGHNSSAIYTDGKSFTIGYEQERLDRIKSSSRFPKDAIMEIIKFCPQVKDVKKIFVSDWFNFSYDRENKNKYFDFFFLEKFFKGAEIQFLNNNFTHHDAHMMSTFSFFIWNCNSAMQPDFHSIVADGFGNDKEVISIYYKNLQDSKPILIDRIYGYKNSLGLMYQYATSFCGMKENQDEYKFLGYESKINLFGENNIKSIEKNSDYIINKIFNYCFNQKNGTSFNKDYNEDVLIDYDELKETKNYWTNIFSDVIKSINFSDTIEEKFEDHDERIKIIIGFFVQNVIEGFFLKILKKYEIKNVLLSGGCFLNVKLNNFILKNIEGFICVNPLSGDQGAAIGMYENSLPYKHFYWGNLCWGKREITLDYFELLTKYNRFKDKIYFLPRDSDTEKFISEKLIKNQIVNLVSYDCEFGPRALCNTSTLMLPNKENVDINNEINNRDSTMPVCPVVISYNMNFFFEREQISRIIGSDKYMVITADYIIDKDERYEGVFHKYPLLDQYSGRPQKINEHIVANILREVENKTEIKCLINTSFNYHGTPINLTMKDCIDTFTKQCKNMSRITNKEICLIFIGK